MNALGWHGSFSVRIEPQGWIFDAPADTALLKSARDAGLCMPSSCRNGTCRACLCQLRQGKVRYDVEWPGLSAEEKAEGWILPCVALPLTALTLIAPKTINLQDAK